MDPLCNPTPGELATANATSCTGEVSCETFANPSCTPTPGELGTANAGLSRTLHAPPHPESLALEVHRHVRECFTLMYEDIRVQGFKKLKAE